MGDFSIADILARGAEQRRRERAGTQPDALLPTLGNLATTGFQVASDNRNRASVMQAQKDYSDYLSKSGSGTATPEETQRGFQAAMSLGINPKPMGGFTDPALVSSLSQKAGIQTPIRGTKENVAALEKLGSLNKTPGNSDQNLTPDEMKALQGAMIRKESPLAPSMISFKGPRAKLMAQSLIKDPNWSPTAGEAGLAGAKAGASAGARLTEGGSSQVVARTAQSAAEQLDLLQKASDGFPRANVQIMNTPILALSKQGSAAAQRWLIAAQTARAEYATALNRGNSPSLEQLHEAEKALPDTLTPVQLPGAIQQLRLGLDATVKGQMTPARASGPQRQNSGAAAAPVSANSDPLGLGI